MGDLNVKLIKTKKEQNDFTRYLLEDLHAMERMLEEDWFEKGQMHIGAEQEICLIDEHYKPACRAGEILDKIQSDNYTTELAKFNVEVNLSPQPFTGSCFTDMANELNWELKMLEKALKGTKLSYLTTGILPTLRKFDLGDDHITPLPRYYALMDAISRMRGQAQEIHIKGYDELNIKHDSAMLEACNTSFQVHLQVTPDDFVEKYNLAQFIAAPTLAISANSPMLFGKRLWHETRIALFQQSIDTRITSEHLRDRSPRVMFGNQWVKDSLLDIIKEDIVRFRPMLMTEHEGNYQEMLNSGITPQLRALTIHNSTVYRWNRPCYGISPNGRPHLRIENRILPSGPTPLDEMANTAFWIGTMNAIGDHYPGIAERLDFSEVKSNFNNCAQTGLNTKIRWFSKDKISVGKIIKEELIPIAREGLAKNNVDAADIDKYLSVIEERSEVGQNGSVWALRSYAQLAKDSSKEEIALAITSSMAKNQQTGKPIHTWELASLQDILKWHPSSILVEEFMTKDLFTVHKEDIIELVADIMDWQHIRFTPVEDKKGKLIGLVSMRMITRHLNKNRGETPGTTTVQDLMIKKPITISPESTIFDAMNLMREHKVGCLPVVKKQTLVGVVTEGNFLNITATLLKIINKSG
ncbi:MAG: glutamate-cysteine ligase family protein [Roseivirga sp.]